MTFVGKTLIVVQVVLSFCFMAFAGAVYTGQINWKAKTESTQDLLTKEKQALADAQTKWNDERRILTEATTAAKNLADSKEVEVVQLQAKVTDLEKDLNDAETIRGSLASESGLSQQEAESRREEALNQRSINEKLHKTQRELLDKLRGAEDQIFAMTKEMEEMERKHLIALEEIATYKQIARANNWNLDPAKFARAQAPPPAVDGFIVDAREANDRGTEVLVEISLGERDGLVAGHQLFVYRPASQNEGRSMYLGKIRLVSVTPNRAVGTVVERAKIGEIKKDDHVTTQL